MNSIYDKLKLFNEVILKDAALERNRILRQIKTEIEEKITLEKKKYQEEVDGLYKKETALIENEKSNIISRALMESKQLLMKTREEIMKTILTDTRNCLMEFVLSDEYYPYLCDQIRRSCELAGSGELVIYLNKKDIERFSAELDELKKELPESTAVEEIGEAGENIIGGCMVLNRSEDFMVNGTLLEKLEANMDSFFVDFGDLEVI